MSFSSAVLVLYSNVGILTLMTLASPGTRLISCLGAINAVLRAASDIPALAITKFLFAERIPASTRLRTSIFSRTRSRYWRISSSRLSFSSLCPRIAVIRFFFRRVSSIRVGFTCVAAKCNHLSFLKSAA